jgi:hypothetical protein
MLTEEIYFQGLDEMHHQSLLLTTPWRHSALGAKRPKTSPVGAFSAVPVKKNQIKYQTTA